LIVCYRLYLDTGIDDPHRLAAMGCDGEADDPAPAAAAERALGDGSTRGAHA
jgi:hypothetical protein